MDGEQNGGGNEGGELAAADILTGGAAAAADGGTTDSSGVGGGSGDADWLERFSADSGEADTPSNRDWLKAKGFKSLDDVVKAHRAAEKAIHDKGGIKLPGEGAAPEEIAAFHKAIGVPDDAKGYEIKGPDGVRLNEPLLARLSEAAHKNGIPKAAFEGVVSDFINAQLDEAAQAEAKQKASIDAALKEWGANSNAKLAHVNAAARALELNGDQLAGLKNALGGDALKILARIGEGMAEDALLGGEGKRRFGVTGAEAQAELDKLKLDPEFQKRVLVKGSPEKARWDRLLEAVAAHEAAKEREER